MGKGPTPQNETHPRKEGFCYFPGGKRGMGDGYIPLVAVDVALPLKSVANCDNMPSKPGLSNDSSLTVGPSRSWKYRTTGEEPEPTQKILQFPSKSILQRGSTRMDSDVQLSATTKLHLSSRPVIGSPQLVSG